MERTALFLNFIQIISGATQHCHGDRCFWISEAPPGDWSQGRTTCQSEGGDLAVMETEELYDFVFFIFTRWKLLFSHNMNNQCQIHDFPDS